MQFARINDIALHYQVVNGPPDKPVLVFVNSLGTDFRIWRDVVVRLFGKATFLTYDKRGHGLSDVGTTPYAIDDHINDLAGLLDHLGCKNVVVVGLSVGGLIAQGLSARRPDLVQALVLCDTAHKIGEADFWNARIAAVQQGGIASIADSILERWFTPAFREPGSAEFAGYRNMLIRQPAAGYTGTIAAIRDTDFTAIAKAISVPTLCVVGDQDGSTPPALVLSLAKLIANARFEVIPGCGHIPPVEKPEIFSEMISAFLSLLGAPAHAGHQRH